MLNPAKVIFEFALEALPTASLQRQAEVYRALAELSSEREQRITLTAQADACDRMLAEQAAHAVRHQQLCLNFKRKS